MRFIGDVHGKFDRYKRIIRTCSESIQVGDMGIGFRRTQGPRVGEFTQNPPHAVMVEHNARFIRGNHDNPGACKSQSQWISDGTVEGTTMFVGGASSIDREWRIEGYSWWPDEELSYHQLDRMVQQYIAIRPRTMVTHDCPEEVADAMLYHLRREKADTKSVTRQAFQAMLSAHSPALWVFGHWHNSIDFTSNGTRFVCLAELEYRDFDI
jgi:hypothetical protein